MPIVNPITATPEVQTITVDATGGTFTVSHAGVTTAALAFNVSAAAFTTAMQGLAGPGTCVVTGGPGSSGGGTPYTLTWPFGAAVAPTTDPTSLTGGAGTAVVATTTPGVTPTADPWLTVGEHDEPTGSDPSIYSWCMMEAAAWMADEAWSDDPTNVSPVIAQFAKALNDTLEDDSRQTLKTYLAAAPAGVIDTVDAGLEAERVSLATDWLVRTYVPAWLDVAGMTDEADILQALPAIASGTMDAEETEVALSAAGTVAKAVSDYNWSDSDWCTMPGDGRVDYPIAGDYFHYLWPDLVADTDHATLELALRCARGAGWDSLGNDAGQVAWDGARRMARAASWDVSGVVHSLSWDSTRATPSPWKAVTGGVTDENSVGLAAWIVARDAAFAACTQGKAARQTHDIYDVRFAAWLAWLDAEADGLGVSPAQAAYAAASTAAFTILSPVFTTVETSAFALLASMCAAT